MSRDRIFVINLARSKARLAAMAAALEKQGLSFERVDAVDGATLEDSVVASVAPPELIRKTYHRPLSKSEVACALSHRKAWQQIIDQDLDFGIVLEDDALPEENFSATVELIRQLPKGSWDFLKLYALTRREESNIARQFHHGDHRFVVYRKFPLGFQGQAISREAALSMTKHLTKVTEPADAQLKSWWEARIYPFGLLPYSVSTDVGGQSDINPDSGLESIRQNRWTKIANKIRRGAARAWWTPRLYRRFREFERRVT